MKKRLKHLMSRTIDKFVCPLVPARYRLAVQYFKYVYLMAWEPEIHHIRDYARKGVALDVGANIGLWSFSMVHSGLFDEIISFEPNYKLTNDLTNANLKGVRVVNKAVSSITSRARLRIPRQGKVSLTGWASLEEQIDLNTMEFDEFDVETINLDDLGLTNVGFVKIDVEGHELSVLKGARDLFTNSRPTCIIECRERNKRSVELFFRGLCVGYQMVNTHTKYGFPLSPGNFLFATR